MPKDANNNDHIDDDNEDVTLDSLPEDIRPKVQKLLDKETGGLKAKRDELLGKLKEAKKGGANQEEVTRLNARIAELESGNDGDKDAVRRRIEDTANRKVTDAEGRASKAEEKANRVIIDSALRKGCSEVKVVDGLTESALALIKSKYAVEVDDEGEATIDGKGVAEFMKDWAKTDEGKAHVSARANDGGGSSGNFRIAGQAGTIKTKADLKTTADKTKFISEHGMEAFRNLPVK